MTKLLDRLNSLAAFKVAVLGTLLGHFLDLASSELCFWTGAGYELNELLANPTGGMYLLKAILIKSVWLTLGCVTPAYFLRKWSKSWLLAALPFVYEAFRIFLTVDAHNFEIFFVHALRSLHV